MPRFQISILLVLLAIGCATPAHTTALVDEADVYRQRADRAMDAGSHDAAAAAYAESFLLYREGLEMASDLLEAEGGPPNARLAQYRAHALEALPGTAHLAAEAYSELGLRLWREANAKYDHGRLREAATLYEQSISSFVAEERWLREFLHHIAAEGEWSDSQSHQEERWSIQSDIAQVEKDRKAVALNLALTIRRAHKEDPTVAKQILDGLVVGLGFFGTALEQVGMVLLAIITEPAFWEILRICVEVACCFGGS
ncbi:MAG: hypothetical protein O7H41_14010 [Planctomycetota bacterium]|nr:hypothetical protein [Planctomycetota bacterium]